MLKSKAAFAATTALGMCFGSPPPGASAQSLGEAVNGMLANNCEALLGTDRIETTLAPVTSASSIYSGELPTWAGGAPVTGLVAGGAPVTSISLQSYLELAFDYAQSDLVAAVNPDGTTSGQIDNLFFTGDPAIADLVWPTDGDGYSTAFIITQTTTTTTTTETAFAPVPGVLGGGLETACQGSAFDVVTSITQRIEDVEVTDDGNGETASSVVHGATSTTNTAGSGGSVVSGSGVGASRLQDGLARRESGLRALIERLWRRAREQRRDRRSELSLAKSINETTMGMSSPRPFEVVVDLSVRSVSLDRSATPLEGAFQAESRQLAGSAAIVFNNGYLLGGSVGHEETDSSASSSNGGIEFDNRSTSGSLFAGWSGGELDLGFEQPASLAATVGAYRGQGDQSYRRMFIAESGTSTTTTINGVTSEDIQTTLTPHSMTGDVDQAFSGVALNVEASQSFGGVTVSPRLVVSYVRVETEGYSEGGSSGFELDYADTEDEWIETRLGLNFSTGMLIGNASVTLSAGGDAVFVGDAETPTRTAYFSQDLRSQPTPIVYQVDNLDDQFFDWNASATLQYDNGFQPFAGAFVRSGHDYLDMHGFVVGARARF